MSDVDVAMNDVRPSAATSAAIANANAIAAANNGSREVWRAPLSRGDSTVSARDSKYWLSVASSSSARSLASSSSAAPSPSPSVSFEVNAALSTTSAPVDLRNQTILPISVSIPIQIAKRQQQQRPLARHNLSTSPLKYNEVGNGGGGNEFLNPFQFARVLAATAGESTNSQSPAKHAHDEDIAPVSAQARPRRNSAFHQSIVAEEVFENQRYQMVLGWGSKGHLLPLDPGKYMRAIKRPPRRSSATIIRKSRRRRKSLGDFTFGSPRYNAFELCGGGGGNGEETLEVDQGNENGNGADYEDDEDENCDIEWVHSPIFPDISLPECATIAGNLGNATTVAGGMRWEWISPWHLEFPPHTPGDPPADADGWQYSTSFQHFSRLTSDQQQQQQQLMPPSPGPPPRSPSAFDQQRRRAQSCTSPVAPAPVPVNNPLVSSYWRSKHYVRCRKWIRYRRLRSPTTAQEEHEQQITEVNAFDDSFLDSMCGWLRKLGHVRKNWKSRYFVLEKSVLRYYADESMARLKGEVLLFHPATRVHYVDIHLSGGKDCTFAIHVGKDYALLLQADQLSDRENWMYCIEDALLCRDSYHQDPDQARDLRESVALRRRLSSESMVFNNKVNNNHGGGGGGGIHPLNLLILDSKTVLKKAAQDSLMMRILAECDAFLESKQVKQLAVTFMQKFKQKYAVAQANNHGEGRRRGASDTQQQQRDSAAGRTSFDSPTVAVLQDARSLLALKNYRFFIERSLATVLNHLAQLPFVTGSPVTSPRGYNKQLMKPLSPVNDNDCVNGSGILTSSSSLVSEDEWQLVRKAALYKLERMTFIPLQDVIYNLLESTISPSELENFECNRRYLGAQTQAFFEIPESHTSSLQWKSAISLLNTIDNYSLPCEKSSVLLEVAKCIYETHANEHGGALAAAGPAMMAADDFLPIFIYILARSSLRNVVVARHLVSETMISALMIGETGYYATMLEAAVGYIASFEVAGA